jgi:hypothetical protein
MRSHEIIGNQQAGVDAEDRIAGAPLPCSECELKPYRQPAVSSKLDSLELRRLLAWPAQMVVDYAVSHTIREVRGCVRPMDLLLGAGKYVAANLYGVLLEQGLEMFWKRIAVLALQLKEPGRGIFELAYPLSTDVVEAVGTLPRLLSSYWALDQFLTAIAENGKVF